MNIIKSLARPVVMLSFLVTPSVTLAQSQPNSLPAPRQVNRDVLLNALGGGSLFPPVKHDPIRDENTRESNTAVARGDALLKAGNFEEALSSYSRAINFLPENGLGYLGLAETYTAQEQYSKAIDTYRTLFYNWPGKNWGQSCETSTTNLMHFALVLLKTGQRDEALKVYQQGVHYLPTDRGPLPPKFTTSDFALADFEASAYTAMGLYEKAWGSATDSTAYFEQAISTQPSLAAPYYYRGEYLKYEPGRAADAMAAFKQAEQLGGSEMKPFVDKALKTGTSEFKASVKKSGEIAQ